jgi:hypothetical protein
MQYPISSSEFSAFDIIGDVHGCASKLKALLYAMDYRVVDGCYRYCGKGKARQVIFVGDLIDRGDEIVETLAIAKAMIDQGQALMVLGNHEFNALAYHTPIEDGFLRPRNQRSDAQIEATLDQFNGQEALWQLYLNWFATLPLFLEFEHFRVVHACWDASFIKGYRDFYKTHCLTDEAIEDCQNHQSAAGLAIERLTRGISLALPEGLSITGRDGFKRFGFRVNFWSENPECYNDVVFQPDPLPSEVAEHVLSAKEKNKLIHYKRDEKPLFVGHYWLDGEPDLISSNIACLDYSAVNGGQLVAYRFDCDSPRLDKRHFVAV